MINLAICDDDPYIIEQLENFINALSDITFNYEVFFSAEELYRYKQQQKVEFDLYILDIEIKAESGLELAKKLRQDSPYALIICKRLIFG